MTIYNGTTGNDTYTGGGDNDTINGNDGNDLLAGGGGNDLMSGNAGDDIIGGDAGNDTVFGNDGNDNLQGNDGDDVLDGGDGNDTLMGDLVTSSSNVGGSDLIHGGLGDDSIFGGMAQDTIHGDDGNDWVFAGGDVFGDAGDDYIISFGSDLGRTTLSGGLGNDTITINPYVYNGSVQLNGDDGDDSLTGGAGNESLFGGAGNDSLAGVGGADVLTGGAGNDNLYAGMGDGGQLLGGEGDDRLTGYGGNDNLSGGLGADVFVYGETRAFGTDTLTDFVRGTDRIDLQALGVADLDSLAPFITQSGADTVIELSHSDVFGVTQVERIVLRNITAANLTAADFVFNTSTTGLYVYSLDGNDVLFGGAGNDTFQSGSGADRLVAGSGNDSLDGGMGADTIAGGAGDDTYRVNDGDDSLVERNGDGTDLVIAGLSYTLAANIENLTFTEGVVGTATGNGLDNLITGAVLAANTLNGGDGNDRLVDIDNWSATFDDTLNGGAGDDILTATGGTNVLDGGAGYDIADYSSQYESVAVTLGAVATGPGIFAVSVEEVRGGSGYDRLTGDGANNLLYGNGGQDTIDGGDGADALHGGDDSDLIDGGLGADTVYGDGGSDVLTGGEGDILDGGDGWDRLTGTGNAVLRGGGGNDTYYVSDTRTVVDESTATSWEFDEVDASVSFTLGVNVENLNLTGTANIDGTGTAGNNLITGNEGANVLRGQAGNDGLSGNAGADVLYGGAGDDWMTGGVGADTFYGGAGNDSYYIYDATDVISETTVAGIDDGGVDSVFSSVNSVLADGLENLYLNVGAISAIGNALDNVIVGNDEGNSLGGLGGNDRLNGATGNDTMTGGTGNDTYAVDSVADVVVENSGEGVDTVELLAAFNYVLAAGVDNLALWQFAGGHGVGNALNNAITATNSNDWLDGAAGNDTLTGYGGHDTYIVDSAGDVVVELQEFGSDTVLASASYVLSNNIENLTLTGNAAINGTGNAGANELRGNAGINILTGLGGNDTYFVNTSGDTVIEAAAGGSDSVFSSVRFALGANIERLILTGTASIAGTGNATANALTGNSGNNRIDGGMGADTMAGGLGDDNYVIDDAGDRVFENANEGNDSVSAGFSYSLGTQYVENLTLTGTNDLTATGNALANTLIGNSGNNVLNGGNGVDNLWGGSGNDTYYVDNVSDRTFEKTTSSTDAGGHDVVYASVRVTLDQFVEDLVITGTAGLAGTGNGLNNTITGNSGNNALLGKDGNDVLDGAAGADIMAGGLGNDTFHVDNVADRVAELNGQGNDTVLSSVNFALGNQYIETLILTGGNAVSAKGNVLANSLLGNYATNTLDGGAGNDTLTGGGEADVFLFGLKSGADIITDFSAADGDSINLHAYAQGTVNGGGIIIAQVGADTLITLGGGNVITVQNTLTTDVTGHIVW